MKFIGISGSARKDGNTAFLINALFQRLNREDVATELIQLAENRIEPCKACFACGGQKNCAHEQDSFRVIFQKMVEADGIILGSPVYAANVSASMQALLERAAVVCDMNSGLMRHKVGAAVAAARRGGALNAVDAMNHFFLNHEMIVVGSTYWNMGYGQLSGDVLQDAEALANMENLAENLIWLMKGWK